MVPNDEETGPSEFKCGAHPSEDAYPCFMCRHLVGGEGLGLHQSYGNDEARPDAWCNDCEVMRLKCGGWDDRSEKFADIRQLCCFCYDDKAQANQGSETTLSFLKTCLETQGWVAAKKYGDSNSPSAFYTVGLTRKFKHPEIYVSGLPRGLLDCVLDEAVCRISRGMPFSDGARYSGLIGDHHCYFRTVLPKHFPEYMPEGIEILGPSFAALQCIWPDEYNRYPWDAGYPDEIQDLQPTLWR